MTTRGCHRERSGWGDTGAAGQGEGEGAGDAVVHDQDASHRRSLVVIAED